MTNITINDSKLTPSVIDLPNEERFGSFMFHSIQWIRQTDDYEILRKIFAISVAILLSCSIIGLVIVIPGIFEWNWQANQDLNSSPIINIIGKDSTQNPFMRFDNLAARGEINGLYITTNEKNLATTDQLLANHPLRENTIHIGCASWHNLDIMCKRKSNFGLIVDFNPKNAEFIKKTLELVQTSESRNIFVSNMITYLNSLEEKEREIFFHKDQEGLPTDRIEKELVREGSWLGHPESYEFIKNLASNNKITSITEDIKNYKNFSEIRKYLDANNILIDTVYLSNICNFMRTKNDQESFAKSITHIVDKDTLFINCPRIKHKDHSPAIILHQHTLLGSEILKKTFNQSLLFELLKE